MDYKALYELTEHADTYWGRRIAAEAALEPLRACAKSKTVLCVAHAHIDMNWQWGYQETVQITLATFRTMLQLMREYPAFTFSQSQASCYEIVEKYAPELLGEIRARIAEGRWEVAAVNWVEPDKNMPDGEEQTRHILYTKRYLSRLLGIDADDLRVDFEPDTFGHNGNVPQILSDCGVRYLYHCRGNFAPALYYWRAPAGGRILVYREPTCYNWDLKPSDFRTVPRFAADYGIDTLLRVYGVGDHGGGATRKDIELLLDMNTWPAMPTFRFGSYRAFFESVEAKNPPLEELTGGQNFVFRGCYSTQSRIKAANRRNLALFARTEQAQALIARVADARTFRIGLDEAWHNHLFGHFHDIITGSGVIETREYQLGKAQETEARLATLDTNALLRLGEAIDTSVFSRATDLSGSIALGAGAGYDRGIASPNVAEGNTRLYLAYNSGREAGRRTFELVLWDYEGAAEHLRVRDADGAVAFETLDDKPWHYWGHWGRRILVTASVPAYGYSVLIVDDGRVEKRPVTFPPIFQRREDAPAYILENEYLRAEFDPDQASLKSLTDKTTGRVLTGAPLAYFRYIEEENSKGMSGWVTGNYSRVTPLTEGAKIIADSARFGALRQSFVTEAKFASSRLKAIVSLSAGERFLRYECECDFLDAGGETIPQLGFACATTDARRYGYDVPYGMSYLPEENADVVANSFAYADYGGEGLILTTDSKYGFRADKGVLSVNLLRASFDPDPFPETMRHRFVIGLGFGHGKESDVINTARAFAQPVQTASIGAHEGTLPLAGSLFGIQGRVVVSAIKPAEASTDDLVRLYNPNQTAERATLTFASELERASLCDGLERPLAALACDGCRVSAEVPACGVIAVRAAYKEK